MSTLHSYFGTLVATGGELRWSAHLDAGGRQVAVELSAPLDVSEAALDAAARIPMALGQFDAIGRGALEAALDHEEVGIYVEHHLAELAPARIETLFGAPANEVTPAAFLGAMYLARVWLHPGDDGIAVLDYSIDPELTDYVLAVKIDEQSEVVGIAMES